MLFPTTGRNEIEVGAVHPLYSNAPKRATAFVPNRVRRRRDRERTCSHAAAGGGSDGEELGEASYLSGVALHWPTPFCNSARPRTRPLLVFF